MSRLGYALAAAALVLTAASASLARTVTIEITDNDIQAYAPEDESLGKYYAFHVPIPERLAKESLMDAYLEVHVEATSDVEAAALGGIVTLEVFPLRSQLSADLAPSDLRAASMKRSVRIGEARRLRIGIREYVAYALEHPDQDFGLVMGSLTGQRLGKFTLKRGTLDGGSTARMTIIFQDRIDGIDGGGAR